MKSTIRPKVGDVHTKDEFQRTTAPTTESDLTLGDVFQTLMRHKWFILGCFLASVTVSAIIAYTRTPVYEATGSLRIDPHRATSLGLALAAQGGGANDQLDTEIETIKSEAVAINSLNLLSDANFKKFSGVPRSVGGITNDAIRLTPQQQGILGQFKSNLNVHENGTTQLVLVSFRSTDPELSAELANDVIQAYLKQSFDSRYGSVEQVRTWLSAEMNKLREEASEAQTRLAKFQEQNNILETSAGTGTTAGGSSNITLDTLKQLNTSLTSARGESIAREAQMRAVLAASPDVVASISPNVDVSSILATRSALAARYAELASKFGEKYPPLIEVRQEIAQNNARFDAGIAEIRRHATSDYAAAKNTEQLLQSQYDEQVQRAYAQNRLEAEYAVLNVETRSASTLYDTLQGKLQEAGVDAGLNAINTVPLDRARVPLVPIEPKKTLIISAGIMIGLFLGVGASFLREIVTDTVQSADLLEKRFRLHVLSLIPRFAPVPSGSEAEGRGTNRAALGPTAMLVSYLTPKSRVTESFRNLRNGILLSQEKVKTILVTSALASEGKSMTASNYAVVMAQQGAKVLLIDADLRRPMVHRYFGISNASGLGDLILNENAQPAFYTPLETLDNLKVLTAGGTRSLPSEILGSQRMRSLLENWENEFDYVIIDSAPLLVVSDSLPLAQWADALVLVVRFNQTPVAAIRRLKAVLEQVQTSITGVVLNDLPESNASYGSYGYGAGYYE